jgi:hypothetical protein
MNLLPIQICKEILMKKESSIKEKYNALFHLMSRFDSEAALVLKEIYFLPI